MKRFARPSGPCANSANGRAALACPDLVRQARHRDPDKVPEPEVLLDNIAFNRAKQGMSETDMPSRALCH